MVLFAAAQIVVHMIFFLHMNSKSEGGWNMLALLFTVMLVVIVLSGSLWVMHHLNANMMPMARSMPMVRTHRAMRDFCVAKTCSTAERTFERAALARWCRRSIGLPLGFRKWIIDLSLARRIAASFFAER